VGAFPFLSFAANDPALFPPGRDILPLVFFFSPRRPAKPFLLLAPRMASYWRFPPFFSQHETSGSSDLVEGLGLFEKDFPPG